MAANAMCKTYHNTNLNDCIQELADKGKAVDVIQEESKADVPALELRGLRVYGAIDGVEIGMTWESRAECSTAGIHVPIDADIHGGLDGAYSVALCDSLESDTDHGECFICTGGGQQTLIEKNAALEMTDILPPITENEASQQGVPLSRSFETGNPVRVIRGFRLNTSYAPKSGYRYDGLYIVKKFWKMYDLEGKMSYRYALLRCGNQPAPPWDTESLSENIHHCLVDDILASETTSLAGNSCVSRLVERDSGQPQEIVVKSQNFSLRLCEDDGQGNSTPSGIKRYETDICSNTGIPTENNMKNESHSEINGNNIEPEKMPNGLAFSHIAAQSDHKIQSCLKKSKTPVKKTVTFRVDGDSKQPGVARQVDFDYEMESPALKQLVAKRTKRKQMPTVPSQGVHTKRAYSPVKLARTKVFTSAVLDGGNGIHKGPKESLKKSGIVHTQPEDGRTTKSHHVFVSSENVTQDITCSVRHPVAVGAKTKRVMELKLTKINLPDLVKKKGHFKTNSGHAKVSNLHVQKDKSVKTRKSTSDTEDVSAPKRSKPISVPANRSVFTADCDSSKQNGTNVPQGRKSARIYMDVSRNATYKRPRKSTNGPNEIFGTTPHKQISLVRDCEVQIERLSPEVLYKALSGVKEQQSAETRSISMKHHRLKSDKSCFQKSSDIDLGSKEETQGNLSPNKEDGSFDIQFYEDSWGTDKIDSWGNVRYVLKGYGDLGECEGDWCGWWVRVDSLHDFYNAHLHSISDGVTESRIVVWDNTFESKYISQNDAVKVTGNTEYIPETVQDTEEEWPGWEVLYIKRKI